MQPVKFKVKCAHCQHANVITVSEDMLGKNSLRKCESCGQMFPFMSPTKEKVQQLIQSQQSVQAPSATQPADDEFKTTIRPNFNKAEKVLLLECIANDYNALQRFKVSQPYMTIGRLSYEQGSYMPDLPIETSDVYISRKHAVFKKYTNSFTVSDAGSANGTYLNDKKLQGDEELVLAEGDKVTLGKTIIKISII
jgi:pSer/pThr/pTyr-binding forkhead associated (FHA) protein